MCPRSAWTARLRHAQRLLGINNSQISLEVTAATQILPAQVLNVCFAAQCPRRSRLGIRIDVSDVLYHDDSDRAPHLQYMTTPKVDKALWGAIIEVADRGDRTLLRRDHR